MIQGLNMRAVRQFGNMFFLKCFWFFLFRSLCNSGYVDCFLVNSNILDDFALCILPLPPSLTSVQLKEAFSLSSAEMQKVWTVKRSSGLLHHREEVNKPTAHSLTHSLIDTSRVVFHQASCVLAQGKRNWNNCQSCIFNDPSFYSLQPFSKKAVDHVQTHLAKKQVPPTLFQVKHFPRRPLCFSSALENDALGTSTAWVKHFSFPDSHSTTEDWEYIKQLMESYFYYCFSISNFTCWGLQVLSDQVAPCRAAQVCHGQSSRKRKVLFQKASLGFWLIYWFVCLQETQFHKICKVPCLQKYQIKSCLK